MDQAQLDELLFQAEVEWEHESYFRLKAASHPIARLLKVWPAPAPKADIRASYAEFTRGLAPATGQAPKPVRHCASRRETPQPAPSVDRVRWAGVRGC